MGNSYGTVTVRKLRTGDNINISFGVDNGLVIFYKTNPEKIITDWSDAQNRPTITPSVTSQRGKNITVGSHLWYINGTLIQFDNNTHKSVAPYANKFQLNESTGALTCLDADLFGSPRLFHNIMLTYKCSVARAGINTPQSVDKSCEIEVIEAGANSYWGGIVTTGSTSLSSDNPSVDLDAVLYYNGSKITDSSAYSVVWYVNGTAVTSSISGQLVISNDRKKLTVYRDGVNGMAHVVAKFLVNGNEVEGAGITVRDDSDAIQVIVPDEVYVEEGGTLSIEPRVYNQEQQSYVTATRWDVEIRNNYTEDVVWDSSDPLTPDPPAGVTFNSSTGAFTMLEEYMYYTGDDGGSIEYFPIITFCAEI